MAAGASPYFSDKGLDSHGVKWTHDAFAKKHAMKPAVAGHDTVTPYALTPQSSGLQRTPHGG